MLKKQLIALLLITLFISTLVFSFIFLLLKDSQMRSNYSVEKEVILEELGQLKK